METVSRILIVYLIVMNALGILIMYVDKQKAIHKKWRIPEKSLFLVSILGGSFGTWAGMYFFRHKTKHWYFVLGFPVIFFAHVALLVFLYTKVFV